MFDITRSSFSGFSSRSLDFLRDLGVNNNKEWFAAHRSDYLKHVASPLKALTSSLLPAILELDPEIVSSPNRHISRINRDTRFSSDKSPYWTNPWVAFRHPLENWYQAPTWFFEIHATGYSYGMNVYKPSSATMRRFRMEIDNDPDRFLALTSFVRRSRSLMLETEKYKRQWPCLHSKAIEPWYQSKDIEIVSRHQPDRLLFSPKLIDTMLDCFSRLKPLYDYLWSVTVL